ncbi:MAG TPA: hypothetical protein VN688_05450 [Gemmataceae bacterium]|nr:hypothetical protein [Gemmataceae bacterium]
MRLNRGNERRGVILLVVLALLTLFAIVGITFVLYADYEATSARIAREAESQQRADIAPEQALAMFLGQLIYDVSDTDANGVISGLRGHSLARTMYGYNTSGTGTNTIAFNGVGRLHYPATAGALGGTDDYTLVNYTYFQGDSFLRDPERFGSRSGLGAAQGSYVGGNAPYTYPDLNNFYLAAVRADGTVLIPSFVREYTSFGSLAPSNPNWTNTTNPALKYMVVRPRPAEHPNFPLPEADGRDVKNLVGGPGGNDSIWIDIGAPVMTAPDGTKYKMLVAPLIMDLDGRINLGTAGNILSTSTGNSHVSNQGFGGWEVNLAKVLYGDNATTPTEYINLFLGQGTGAGAQKVYGKYGMNGTPSTPGASAPSGTAAHSYAPGDVNSLNEATPPYSSRPLPPGSPANAATGNPAPNPATNPFAMFQQGYLSGGAELTNHPLLYNLFRPSWFNGTDDRLFRPGDMEALLRPNSTLGQSVDSGSSTLQSDLLRLCPNNFGPSAASSRFRNLVTTLSMDLGTPGISPYWWNGMNPPTAYMTANPNPLLAPFATTSPLFPTLPPTAAVTSSTGPSEFGPDWRAVNANTATYAASNPFAYMSPGGRIRLNRPLPPYPHMGAGATPPYQNQPSNQPMAPPTLSPYGVAYNLTPGNPIFNQFTAAINARQALANDIYRRLLTLAGIAPVAPANLATPLSTDLSPRRWLAQLAVNIVDFIDEDDISTPFNFYTVQDTNGTAVNTGATQGNDDNAVNMATPATGANPTYWVFGTELPKVVLNEVLAEATDTDTTKPAGPNESVKLWLELFNPMPAAVAANTQVQDAYRVPLYVTNPNGLPYSPYCITITQNLMLTGAAAPLLPDTSANVLGKANIVAPFPQSTTNADFANPVPLMSGMGNQPAVQAPPGSGNTINAGIDAGGYFLLGPPAPAVPYQSPIVVASAANPGGVPPNTPILPTTNVMYKPTWVANPPTPDERTTGLKVLLRRLANPYLPLNTNPAAGALYNPYVTVDYIENVPIHSNTPPAAQYNSRGKCQPYGALTQLVPPVAPAVADPTKVQPSSPVVDQQSAAAPVNNVTSTFGLVNSPLPPSGNYDWLVHLDRPVISPMELLHVSAYQPYQLTQRFILGSDNLNNAANMVNPPKPANALNLFGHYAPWLDTPPGPIANMSCPWWFDATLPAGSSHRLYRLFEFFESGDWATGVNGLGRMPGKVNINTYWDAEILQALVDANPSTGIAANAPGNPTNAMDPVAQIFANLLTSRSPGNIPGATGVTGATDRPFLPLSVGLNPSGGTQYPTLGTSVLTDTLLRTAPNNQQLLFQNPTDTSAVHPYLQTQLLTKLYNNVTTRSNTFAVFLTVGFFEVTGTVAGSPNIPQLGAEIGRSEGRQIRHRMFAIVDRTNLAVFSTTSSTAVSAPTVTATPTTAFGNATIALAAPGPIAVGSQLVIEPGTANEETVVVTAVAGNNVTANFSKQHPNPAVTGNPNPNTYTIMMRGNPGPRTTPYDPRLDPGVVPYYSIID